MPQPSPSLCLHVSKTRAGWQGCAKICFSNGDCLTFVALSRWQRGEEISGHIGQEQSSPARALAARRAFLLAVSAAKNPRVSRLIPLPIRLALLAADAVYQLRRRADAGDKGAEERLNLIQQYSVDKTISGALRLNKLMQ